jgi:general secretion pathway protein A
MSEANIRITVEAGKSVARHLNETGTHTHAPCAQRRFLDYYGLHEQPFGVTPDPKFLYLGPKHRQALAALTYGTDSNRGFLTLIAKPGMGKTSLLFEFLEGLRDKARTAFLFQTDGDSRDLMYYLLTDLGASAAGKDLPEMRSILNKMLLEDPAADRPLVLVIDEAQNLDEKALESVRLLSNFERPWMKLVQIVLAGQPQLAEMLERPSMAQFRQRVSFAIRIDPLTGEEVDAYVDHRLRIAGYEGPALFDAGARALLAERSEGIPRTINNMCFCAMSLGWATKRKTIDRKIMRDVAADLDLGSPSEKKESSIKAACGAAPKVPQSARPAGITLPEPSSHNWLTKMAVLSALLIALSWGGMQVGIGKRVQPYWHVVSAAVRNARILRQ